MGKVINLACVGGVGAPDARSELSRNIRIDISSDLIELGHVYYLRALYIIVFQINNFKYLSAILPIL